MKFTVTIPTLIVIITLAIAGVAAASQLIYKPIDPAFGGDPLNGNWLLGVAQAQTEGASTPGFTIDFPDFGSIPQPSASSLSSLPPVSGVGG